MLFTKKLIMPSLNENIKIEYLMVLCKMHPNNYDLGEVIRKKFSYEANREIYNHSKDRRGDKN